MRSPYFLSDSGLSLPCEPGESHLVQENVHMRAEKGIFFPLFYISLPQEQLNKYMRMQNHNSLYLRGTTATSSSSRTDRLPSNRAHAFSGLRMSCFGASSHLCCTIDATQTWVGCMP